MYFVHISRHRQIVIFYFRYTFRFCTLAHKKNRFRFRDLQNLVKHFRYNYRILNISHKKFRFEFRINEKIKTVSITISDFQILFKFIRFRFFIRYFSNKSPIYIVIQTFFLFERQGNIKVIFFKDI